MDYDKQMGDALHCLHCGTDYVVDETYDREFNPGCPGCGWTCTSMSREEG